MRTEVDAQLRGPEATRLELMAAISRLQPDRAEWWYFVVTHGRFMLRLYNSEASEYLMIATYYANYLGGPTDWSSPALQFTISPHDIDDSEVQWLVRDEGADFTMKCGHLYWGQNVAWNKPMSESPFAAWADPSRGCTMDFDVAVEELSFHCGTNPNVDDPRWNAGFLQTLRPYHGRLDADAFQRVVDCVDAVSRHLQDAPHLDRRVINALWGLCHFARDWGLHPDGMLRRNNLITDQEQATLAGWIDDLSARIAMILDGNGT